jgi:hypothetical protein
MATSAYTRSCQQISTTSADAIEELLGQEALLGALALAICPALGATDRLSAWRIWLDFTRAKPAQRTAASLAQADGYAELVLQMAGLTGKDGE